MLAALGIPASARIEGRSLLPALEPLEQRDLLLEDDPQARAAAAEPLRTLALRLDAAQPFGTRAVAQRDQLEALRALGYVDGEGR